jgi:uncharacterized protein YjbJ (UPF0337 family)/vacuolar-type H+-ATPase subunit H
MDMGKEAVETAKQHAHDVVAEIRPELEEKARQVVSDVKEAGKQIAEEVAQELRPVVDKAVSRGKEEAKNAAQEVGINPDALASSASLSGQPSSSAAMGASSSGALTPSTPVANKPLSGQLVANRDTLRGQWKQFKGEIKSKWGQLTDNELTRIEGDIEKLIGALQTRYGYTRARAEQEVNDFFNNRKA